MSQNDGNAGCTHVVPINFQRALERTDDTAAHTKVL